VWRGLAGSLSQGGILLRTIDGSEEKLSTLFTWPTRRQRLGPSGIATWPNTPPLQTVGYPRISGDGRSSLKQLISATKTG